MLELAAMPEYEDSINSHYGQPDLSSKILSELQSAGKDIEGLSREDLASFDELHGGGREATRSLARFAALQEGMHVLDVGSGLGGPARALAEEFGCRVTGLDLTEEFCLAAEMLTVRVGLGDRVTFRNGNALEMPFQDEEFDLVWSQSTLMNIQDKRGLISEIHRVLRRGGRLAFEAVMAGPVSGLHYPVLWAGDPSTNFLTQPEELRRILSEGGFNEIGWRDVTDRLVEMTRRGRAIAMKKESPSLGYNIVIGTDLVQKMANGLRNYEEHRMVAVNGVFDRMQ